MMTVTLMNDATAAVTSYAEASRLVRSEIDALDVGGTEWSGHGAGRIFEDGKQIAHVSYNGRVWKGSRWRPGCEEISITT